MKKLSKDNKSLLANFFSLSTLQALNMLLPLVILPYLVRVLGVENFGLINFSLSIVMYFSIFVSFGFDLSATREISTNRTDSKKISEIFSSVMLIKTAFALVSFIVLYVLVMTIDKLQVHSLLYFVTYGIIVGNVLLPIWFFQGIEQMKYITYVNVASKVGVTILVFIFVQERDDFIYVPALNAAGAILGGLGSLWIAIKYFKIKFYFPSKNVMLSRLLESYHYFLSRIANSGSRYYATTIIGVFFGNALVGYYSMVEKLFYAFLSIGGVISQTIYPYMSRTKNIRFFKKVFLFVAVASIVVIVPTLIFNKMLLSFIFNVQDEVLSTVFLIVFSGSLFGVLSSLLGYPLLAAFGYIKAANNSLIIASILYTLYITLIVLVTKNIYLVSFSIPLYMLIGFVIRIYHIHSYKLFSKVGQNEA